MSKYLHAALANLLARSFNLSVNGNSQLLHIFCVLLSVAFDNLHNNVSDTAFILESFGGGVPIFARMHTSHAVLKPMR